MELEQELNQKINKLAIKYPSLHTLVQQGLTSLLVFIGKECFYKDANAFSTNATNVIKDLNNLLNIKE